MTIYKVGKHEFTHYGKAVSFANRLGGGYDIKIINTYNPARWLLASI